jgi:hypothetical protein
MTNESTRAAFDLRRFWHVSSTPGRRSQQWRLHLTALTLLAAIVLVLVHLFASKLRFLRGTPRSQWRSAAGGISVAYVFIHLIPELSAGQETLARASESVVGFFEYHVYLVSLVGLMTIYGLERAAKRSR